MIWKELIRSILLDVQKGKEPKQEYYMITQKEWENVIHLIVMERYAVNVIFQRDFIEWDRVFICMKNAEIGYAGELFLNDIDIYALTPPEKFHKKYFPITHHPKILFNLPYNEETKSDSVLMSDTFNHIVVGVQR